MAGLGFEETELRLGLPGGGGGGGNDAGEAAARSSGKRGFTETIDLKLKLQPASSAAAEAQQDDQEEEVSAAAEPLLPPAADGRMKRSPSQSSVVTAQPDPEKPRAPKAQVVGWPPVRSFRKNVLAVQAEKGKGVVDSDKPPPPPPPAAAKLVKVSMDGAPYLRKVDLAMYKSYQEISMALQKLFSSFTIGKGMNNGLNESKLKEDLLDGPEYAPTYEDKDGDWMLVGDVPWEMFVDSCKRLRIMKGSEAIGLAPRAMEKCNGRS